MRLPFMLSTMSAKLIDATPQPRIAELGRRLDARFGAFPKTRK